MTQPEDQILKGETVEPIISDGTDVKKDADVNDVLKNGVGAPEQRDRQINIEKHEIDDGNKGKEKKNEAEKFML